MTSEDPEIIATHTDQSLLALMIDRHEDPPELYIIGALGPGAFWHFQAKLAQWERLPPVSAFFDADDSALPPKDQANVGFHVWEGTIEEWATPDSDWEEWKGIWRRATVADFGRFGLAIMED